MAMDSWVQLGRAGLIRYYELTLAADGTAALPMEDIRGGYLMPTEYKSTEDATFVLTLTNTLGIDLLDGNGTITDGTTGGHISPNDRWVISSTLTYTLTGLTAGTVTFRFHVVNE